MIHGLDLFSGIGGISLALQPWVRTVAYCEIDLFCRSVLLSRMAERRLHTGPIWDDVRTLRGNMFAKTKIDIVSGGFPCQPFSHAARGRNTAVDLWPEMFRLIQEIKPRFVFAENVTEKAINVAATALARFGYEVSCAEVCASVVGAAQQRSRHWLFADADGKGKPRFAINAKMAESSTLGLVAKRETYDRALVGTNDGLSMELDAHKRKHALGNAVVPAQARYAFAYLCGARR